MDSTTRRLKTIAETLTAKKRALKYAEQIAGKHARLGDTGWLLSPAAAVPGTLLAVVGGQRARWWSAQATRLRGEVTELTVEARLLRHLDGRDDKTGG
ncbi:MAG: hypothetical protein ACI8RZ_000324 [Myxococcota bacterium]|jgi:hypothetical protein